MQTAAALSEQTEDTPLPDGQRVSYEAIFELAP